MKKLRVVSGVLSIFGLIMIMTSVIMINKSTSFKTITDKKILSSTRLNANSLATATKLYKDSKKSTEITQDVALQTMPNSEIAQAKQERVVVFDNFTLEEIIAKLNKNLGRDLLANKGELIATYSLSKGVDPFLVTSIMLHETGCKWKCSSLARTCNNVAGQKGSPNCKGSYKGFATIDDGIRGAIDNLYKNYFSQGLTTISSIAPKYAESTAWPGKITSYYNSIRNS